MSGERDQLQRLAEQFAPDQVKTKPGKGAAKYVGHAVIVQRLLEVLGGYSMEQVQLIRGYAPEESNKNGKIPGRDDVVVGAIVTFKFHVDGRELTITEAGDVELPLQKANDGARAKDAVSDALKRAAMRIGVGLHLWSKDQYTLDGDLAEPEAPQPPDPAAWQSIGNRGGAIAWAMEQFKADGSGVFNATKHAANSFDKLKKAYLESLPPDERPTADSSDEVKQSHNTNVHKLWVEKVIAAWHDADWSDPSPYEEPEKPKGKAAPKTGKNGAAEARETVTV